MAHAHRDNEDLLEHFETILPRYDRPAPRYTSYPTAPVWGEAYGPDDFLEDLGREDEQPDAGLSIYVHVPFCRSLCHFCACNRVITHDSGLPEQYVDTLRREVDAIREAIPEQRPATQQHWGGGMPTHLSP